MNNIYYKSYLLVLMMMSLIALSLFSITFGPVEITLNQISDIVLYKIGILSESYTFSKIHESVLLDIRLPRIIMAILVGLGLGTAGAILQGLFRNPLVDPGFIGVSSGGAIGAMVAIMFSHHIYLYLPAMLSPFILPILAMMGAFVTTMMVYKMSKVSNKTNIMAMLLSGIAINALSGSIIGLFVSMSSDTELRSFTFWTLGGLDMADWNIVGIVSLFIVIPFLIVYKLQYQMDIFMLGDAESEHLGVNVESLKKKIILISSIVVGVSVSFCGMIGFIGLVTPHLIRLFIGPNHRYLIPGSAILGAILLVLSDLISKTIISPAQLPIGVVTSAIGAPFFVWLILSQKRRFNYAE
ncbi:MAG: hypothetical protein CMG66_02455 [Candidatus Marinimicrobia bacterium]|nr:hypothetical protein [Candidatus Neomarinimicrobiota bacterium]|tara:strand:+ start:32263 stop:33324 length:1062 start_codon:yes stop_codon:yes gene_type:complete